jgi:hypothetical protein
VQTARFDQNVVCGEAHRNNGIFHIAALIAAQLNSQLLVPTVKQGWFVGRETPKNSVEDWGIQYILQC